MKNSYKISLVSVIHFVSLCLSLLIIMACSFERSSAQNKNIDSLLTIFKKDKADTNKVNHSNKLCSEFINKGSYDTALIYGKAALELALNLFEHSSDKTKNETRQIQKSMVNSYCNIGTVYKQQGEYPEALSCYSKALKIAEELGDKKWISQILGNAGIVYYAQGDYPHALDHYFQSLKIREEQGDKKGAIGNLCNIGIIYNDQGDYDKALNVYFKALKMAEELGNKNYCAIIIGNIGVAYAGKPDEAKAQEYYFKALKLAKEFGDKNGIARHLNNIGNIYKNHGDLPKAFDYYFKSLKMREELGAKDLIASTLCNIGSIYTTTGQFNEAERYLKKAVSISDSIGALDLLRQTEEGLSQLYDTIAQFADAGKQYAVAAKNYKLSMLYFKKTITLKDTLFSRENKKQLVRKEMNFEFDKKEAAMKAESEKIKAIAEEKNRKQKIVIWSVACVLLLVSGLAFFIYRGYRQKQNANKLLEEKNVLIENQKQLVEEKNNKITDSINYAKRIQQAILPSPESFKSALPDSFIFFRPKDIVSGDFYWMSEKKDKLIIAVADCTGHGVPGAFMSMIGNTLLNEIVNVKNIVEPDQILNHLNNGIVSILHQNNNEANTQDDGMDITILAIDKIKNEIVFAGANHFSYLINNELLALKGDVFSIGGMFGQEDIKFSSQKIKIDKDDTLYLFTDGFIDQFGGEKNTKFLSGRFEKLLQNIQNSDMEQQKEKLIVAFDDWKGNNKQIDDVCVIGIKI